MDLGVKYVTLGCFITRHSKLAELQECFVVDAFVPQVVDRCKAVNSEHD